MKQIKQFCLEGESPTLSAIASIYVSREVVISVNVSENLLVEGSLFEPFVRSFCNLLYLIICKSPVIMCL